MTVTNAGYQGANQQALAALAADRDRLQERVANLEVELAIMRARMQWKPKRVCAKCGAITGRGVACCGGPGTVTGP